jgi:hypothetical protein
LWLVANKIREEGDGTVMRGYYWLRIEGRNWDMRKKDGSRRRPEEERGSKEARTEKRMYRRTEANSSRQGRKWSTRFPNVSL